MKINNYEVIIGNDGKTAPVWTIALFENGDSLVEEGNGLIKKIKTSKEQVELAAKEFNKAESFVKTATFVESKQKQEEVIEEPVEEFVSLEEPKQEEIVEKPVEEEIIVVENPVIEEIKEESKTIIPKKEEKVHLQNSSHKYSFEEEQHKESIAEVEKATVYQSQNNSRFNYDKLYNKLDPLENLKNDLEVIDPNTITGKVLHVGMKKLSKYDTLIENKDEEVEILEKQKKEIELQIIDKKAEKKELERSKDSDVNILFNAVKQAKQVDAFDKAQEEANEQRKKEEAERKAQAEKEEQESIKKREEMFSRIPMELTIEEPKVPTSIISSKKSSAFDKFRIAEEEIEEYPSFRRVV